MPRTKRAGSGKSHEALRWAVLNLKWHSVHVHALLRGGCWDTCRRAVCRDDRATIAGAERELRGTETRP